MPIAISEETNEKILKSVRRYFSEQLEEELGELQAKLLLDFIIQEIGPSIYNAAIADAQIYFRDRVADVEGACYMPEFAYWQQRKARK